MVRGPTSRGGEQGNHREWNRARMEKDRANRARRKDEERGQQGDKML